MTLMNTEMKHATYTNDAHEIQVQGNDRNTGKNTYSNKIHIIS